MRPIRLTLSGFTSFKEEATLAFDGLDLFVVTGPTGAGKSSLLDAVAFSLYGEIPRASGRTLADFISLGRNKLTTTFEFALGEKRFRVSRTASRRDKGIATKAQLEQWAGQSFRFVEEGVSKVDPRIQTLLGMGPEAFFQAVILPQGQFAKFLKSAAAERRKMLNELLRLQYCERMQKAAGERRRTLETERDNLARRLGDDFAGVSEDALGATRAEAEAVERAVADVGKTLDALDREIDAQERAAALVAERKEKEQALAERTAREPAVEAKRRTLRVARVAPALAPLLDQAARDVDDARKSQAECATLDAAFSVAKAAYDAALEAAETAEEEAEAIPALEARKLALAEAMGKCEYRDRLGEQVRRTADECAKADKKRQTAEAKRAKALAEAAQAEDRLKSLAASAVAWSDADDETSARAREWAAAWPLAKSEADQAQQARADAERRERDARTKRDVAIRARESVDADLAQAETAVSAAQAAHRACQADALRATLVVGEPCPVCHAPVTDVPASSVAGAAPKLAEVEKRLAAARKAHASAARDEAAAVAEADAGARAVAEVAVRVQEATRRVQELRDQSAGLNLGPGDVGAALAAWLESADARRNAHAQNLRDRAVAQERAEAAVRERDAAASVVSDASAAHAEAVRRRDEAAAEYAKVDADVASVGPDPRATLEKIDADVKRLQAAESAAREQEKTLAVRMETVRSRLLSARAALQSANAAVAESRARADAALSEAGVDAEAVRVAMASLAGLASLEAEIHEHERARDAASRRIAEIDVALGPTPPNPAALAKSRADAEKLRADLGHAHAERGRLAEKRDRLASDLTRIAELTRQRDAADAELTIARQLADDLKSDRFQAYLLEETLAELLDGASRQLERLTGDRFGLAFADDQIRVVDHDNAGEQRSPDTLSGGETFLASLALALELSAQVQRSVGAVSLDCLFIDEGFGSLDPESLAVVTDSIRNLQVGGRMVGVITHVPELVEQFERRVVVEKKSGLSSLRILGEPPAPTELLLFR